MAPNSLTFQRPLLCCVSCLLVGSLMGLVFLVVWSKVEAPPLVCIRSLTSVILNSLCDNFGPQEGRMIKLLRMASLEGGEIAFLTISRSIC